MERAIKKRKTDDTASQNVDNANAASHNSDDNSSRGPSKTKVVLWFFFWISEGYLST